MLSTSPLRPFLPSLLEEWKWWWFSNSDLIFSRPIFKVIYCSLLPVKVISFLEKIRNLLKYRYFIDNDSSSFSWHFLSSKPCMIMKKRLVWQLWLALKAIRFFFCIWDLPVKNLLVYKSQPPGLRNLFNLNNGLVSLLLGFLDFSVSLLAWQRQINEVCIRLFGTVTFRSFTQLSYNTAQPANYNHCHINTVPQ